MLKNKVLVLFLVSILIIPYLFSNNSILSANIMKKSISNSENPENYLIKGVPYINQETGFYCNYACTTMVLNYYGLNTTFHDILYNSGTGYSLLYSHNLQPFLPLSGSQFSCWAADNIFLANLYGLSFKEWRANKTLPDDKCWREYWTRIKQNITQNTPVISIVDWFILTYLNYHNKTSSLSKRLRNYLPSTCGHAITIVGYNESNNTICYNDPASVLLGKPLDGHYFWIDKNIFKKAVRENILSYFFQIYENTSNDPMSKDEIFQKAHKRNIERLRGNSSVYDESIFNYLSDAKLGINASEALKNNFEKGIRNQLKTIYSYKFRGIKGVRSWIIDELVPYMFNFLKITQPIYELFKIMIQLARNSYNIVAIEKGYTAEYLEQYSNNNSNNDEAILFKYDAENWSKLAYHYSQFDKKGFFMSLPNAMAIMNKMDYTMNNIISIQKAIVV
jgi:hypothetical protein